LHLLQRACVHIDQVLGNSRELIQGAGTWATGLLSPSRVLRKPGDLGTGSAERFAIWILAFLVVLAGEGNVFWDI